MYSVTIITLGLIMSGQCQYQQQQKQRDQELYPTAPPPQILTHKQALNHDGNFKYLFTSENGLAQGESIAPDGSRNGGYSYVDPNGRKISVKYTAGKEGFRILEADHLPKAPQPVAPVPAAPAPQQAQAYTQAQPQTYDDGHYKPQRYNPAPQQTYTRPVYQNQAYTQPKPTYSQLRAQPDPISNSLNEKEPEYNDEPGKPYSFGNGYIFEFGG
ncbi:cuticle protein 3-like [Cylas formicarius]|uniref:cuticle protein 3-like n=1 Tax=Cylas formicarius TaxID=197179 RepID=UPI002958A38E|nr:cuticle protein 3-like [Cylas formicarius]